MDDKYCDKCGREMELSGGPGQHWYCSDCYNRQAAAFRAERDLKETYANIQRLAARTQEEQRPNE